VDSRCGAATTSFRAERITDLEVGDQPMSDNDRLVDSWRDEFQRTYEDDPRNASRQSFGDYWGWVRTFLVAGGAGQRGWFDQGDDVLRGVRDAVTADRLRLRVQELGRAIAAEWAKDSGARRIHSTFLQGSPNLGDWGRQLKRAAAADTGDGKAIAASLDSIERDVNAALG